MNGVFVFCSVLLERAPSNEIRGHLSVQMTFFGVPEIGSYAIE